MALGETLAGLIAEVPKAMCEPATLASVLRNSNELAELEAVVQSWFEDDPQVAQAVERARGRDRAKLASYLLQSVIAAVLCELGFDDVGGARVRPIDVLDHRQLFPHGEAESLGLMFFTIEIMKERLTSSELPPLTLALTNCRRMPCIASRSATPNASAMSSSPSFGSGWSMEMPCDKSFIRGAVAAFVWSVAAIAVEGVGSGAVFMLRSLAGARGKRAVRPRAGDRSPRRSFAIKMGEDFRLQIATDAPASAGRRAFTDCAMMKECP